MKEQTIVFIEGSILRLDSGLSPEAFGKIKVQKEEGVLALLAPDGSITYEPWAFTGTEVLPVAGQAAPTGSSDEKHVFYTGDLTGWKAPAALPVLLAAGKGEQALSAVANLCRAVKDAPLDKAPLGTVGAGGMVVDTSSDGGVLRLLFLPPEIFEISARNHGPGLYAEVQGAFVNKSLRDGPARAFTRSALAYRALCGRNAYGAEDSTLRQTDMFDGNFVPLELQLPGLPRAVSAAINAGLSIPAALRPLPGEKRALAKDLAENEAARARAVAAFDQAGVCSFLEEAAANPPAPDAGQQAALAAAREAWQKKQGRRIFLRRFLRRNRTALSLGVFAVLLAVWAAVSFERGNAKLATTRGLNSRQTVETLYTGVHQSDVTVIREAGKGLKDMMTVVSGFYVTNKQRFAMDQQNGTLSPAEWFFFKNETDFWQYGLTQFMIDGTAADCSFDYPRRRDKPAPLREEKGLPLQKGAVAHHSVSYNMVHTDSSEMLYVEAVTDQVTVTWKGDRWRVTAVESSSETKPVKLKSYRADYAAALEQAGGDLARAVEVLRAKYDWLPTDRELAAGARRMVEEYNNSTAAAYLE